MGIMKRLLRWIAPVLLLLGGWLASASAQNAAPVGAPPPKADQSTSPLPYVVAVVYTILVLWVVCMPSRKGT